MSARPLDLAKWDVLQNMHAYSVRLLAAKAADSWSLGFVDSPFGHLLDRLEVGAHAASLFSLSHLYGE